MPYQGRSQKWPREGVLRAEMVKGGGFEGAEELRIRVRTSFCKSFGENDQKILANGGVGGSDLHVPNLATPLLLATSAIHLITVVPPCLLGLT